MVYFKLEADLLEKLEQQLVYTEKKKPGKVEIENKLRGHIKIANLELSGNNELRIEDQMLDIFRDYSAASKIERARLYYYAEQRVLTIFDPPGESQGAKARKAGSSS